MERQEFITDEHLEYLDALRESGIVNMYGATPYVQEEFSLSRHEARHVLRYWVDTFSERHELKATNIDRAVIAKLHAEGLSLDSPWPEIEACLSKVVMPTACIAAAREMIEKRQR